MAEKNRKVVSIRKYGSRSTWNVGLVLFGIVFLYLLITLVTYLTKDRVTSYEVRQGSIQRDTAFTGLVLRSEMVYYAESDGYINYFQAAGSRAGTGDSVYTLSAEPLPETEETESQDVSVSQEDWNQILAEVQNYHETSDGQNFQTSTSLKQNVTDILQSKTSQNRAVQLSTLLAEGNVANMTVVQSTDDGILEYATDGFESLLPDDITDSDILRHDYTVTEFANNTKVKAGDPVYKLITDEEWTLVIKLTLETEKELRDMEMDGSTVRVRFLRDNQTMNASFQIINRGEDDAYGYLTFSSGMIRYAGERYLDIELELENESGLKIPKSAVTEKSVWLVPEDYLTTGGASSGEGFLVQKGDSAEFTAATVWYRDTESGMLYVDPGDLEAGDVLLMPESSLTFTVGEEGTLQGVYCINKGYAQFRQVQILTESEEYYIVAEGSSYGLSNYDHIALDGSTLQENDIVNQ